MTSWVARDTVQTFKKISTLSLNSYLNFYSQFQKQKSGETQSTDKAKALHFTSAVPSVTRLVSMEADGVPFTPFLCQCSVLRVFKVIATRIRGKSKQTLKSPSIEQGTSWLRQSRTHQLSHAYCYPDKLPNLALSHARLTGQATSVLSWFDCSADVEFNSVEYKNTIVAGQPEQLQNTA